MSSKMTSLSYDLWKECCKYENVRFPKPGTVEHDRVLVHWRRLQEKMQDKAYVAKLQAWKDNREKV